MVVAILPKYYQNTSETVGFLIWFLNYMKQTKVLFLITKSNWGGAQRYVYDLATKLSPEKYAVTVALGGEGVLKDKLVTKGIKTISLREMKNETSLLRIRTASTELTRVLQETKPDVLHSNSSLAGIAGALAARRARVPVTIFTAHAWAFNEDRSLIQRILIKSIHWLTVFLTDKTIAVSHAVQQQMNWPGVQKKMTVVHNGRPQIDFLERHEARVALAKRAPQLQSFHDETWTGTIGELHPIKRHNIMIEAVAKLVAEGHQLRHCIIGDGQQQAELEALVTKHKLSEHVFFLGHIDDAAQYLKAFDLYIQPSRSEALAYVVIEATQAGLPIVATDVGGIPEVITNGTEGILIPPDQATQIAKAILQLLSNPTQAAQYAQAAQEKSQQFSLETMLEKTMEIYGSSSPRT